MTKGLFIPPGWGSFWKPKLAAAKTGTGLATLALPGDSVTRGYYASALAKGWAGLLAAQLTGAAGSVSDGGSGFQSVADTAVYMQALGLTAAQTATYDSGGTAEFMTTTGSWSTDLNTTAAVVFDGPAATYLKGQLNATITAKRRGTAVTVYGIQATSGQTISVAIDGGAAQSYAIASAAGIFAASYTGLSNTLHTVVVTVTSIGGGSTPVYISGISGQNTTGVVVNNFGRGGQNAYELSNVAGSQTIPTSSGTLSRGSAPSGSFGPAGLWTGGPSYPADLVIYGEGLNDLNASLTPDGYTSAVHRYLDGVRGARGVGGATGNTDVLICTPHWGNFDTNYYGADYSLRLRALAEHYGAALIDFSAIGRNSYPYWASLSYWGGGPSNPGVAGTDPGHPSDAGHAFMASVIAPIVTATT